ncbi:flavin reductase [Pseudolysinimonas yzui]|uniref:Flavin reductase n=1 Tax=Pseudolysinimonas yzui TaxID=2708254 RepID=A0A8J3DU04_9MICO|nr:flavin reductase [Pseudolysinimonas yzui]GHF05403.1 flavin reductase [Pseudolysinimonas yzui]
MSDGTAAPPEATRTEWWRAVLNEYPTGVSLVTARRANGDPVGMIVGSFVAVSEEPPLIGYFGDDVSTTFPAFLEADRFAVSVLSHAHDDLLRAFIRKDPDRYQRPELVTTPGGLLRLGDAVAWFEARTESIQRYGDHQLVVGAVGDFGVGSADAGSPLLYRRGGFGAFTVPSDGVDARLIGERLAAAQSASEILQTVADRIGRDIAITTLAGESVVVLSMVAASQSELRSALPPPRMPGAGPVRAIGLSLPFAAPVEPLFAAWAPDRVRSFWIERARHLVGAVDRRRVEGQLAAIRERGYAVSVDQDLTFRFMSLVTDPTVAHESYARVWSEYASRVVESVSSELPLSDIAAIQVPVFDAHGEVVLGLTVSAVGPFDEIADLDAFAAQLIEAAALISQALDPGRRP